MKFEKMPNNENVLENQENLDERHDNWFKDKVQNWAADHPDVIEKIKLYASGTVAAGAAVGTFLSLEDPNARQFMSLVNGVSSGSLTYMALSALSHKLGLEGNFDTNKEQNI